MKTIILAALAVVGLGLGAANAATTAQHAQSHRPNYYNLLAGGGG